MTRPDTTSPGPYAMLTLGLKGFIGRLIWVAFAFLFFFSGLFTTEWLLEPEQFAGEWIQWALIALFPFLFFGFFIVNRRFGCASGACRAVSAKTCESDDRCRPRTCQS